MSDVIIEYPQFSAEGLPITYVPDPFLADGKPVDSQWKPPVRTYTDAALTLYGLQTVNGVGVMEGDRVLVKDQILPAENGIYLASATAWRRAPDMYLWPQFVGAVVATEENITLTQTIWVCQVNSTGIVGTDAVNWVSVAASVGTLGVFTPLRAIVSDVVGEPIVSPTTSQEIAYVSGVTSAIQPQLDAVASTANGAFAIAVNGTNAAAAAQNKADDAYSLAQIGTNIAAAAFSIAVDGTNAASGAQSTASSAYAIAVAGTTVGSAAYAYATTLGDKYVRTTRFATISAGTSGTVALPANAAVVLDDFGGTTDAIVTGLSGGRPTSSHVFTTSGAVVTTAFDSGGNYALSGAPDSYPVALVYRVRQKLSEYTSTDTDIIGGYDVEALDSVAGTADQIYVNGSLGPQYGPINLSLPQSIGTNSSPTFASVSASNITSVTARANAAYTLAQVGTNVGTNAYNLATAGSNVGYAAYTLAVTGTYFTKVGTAYIGGDKTGNTRGAGALDVQAARGGVTQVASGLNSVALGYNCTASAQATLALGASCTASAIGAVAVGSTAACTAQNSMSVGRNTTASAAYTATVGMNSLATSPGAMSFGVGNTSSASNAVAVGTAATASGAYSAALGNYVTAIGERALALGTGSNTGEYPSTSATGVGSVALGTCSGYLGAPTVANAGGATAVGVGAAAIGLKATAVGYTSTASGYYSSAFGYNNTASVLKSTAVGAQNTVSGNYASAFGYGNSASGYYSAALGWSNATSANLSSAVGCFNSADGANSSAFGRKNTASGDNSSVFGYNSTASGYDSNVFGRDCLANSARASAFGYLCAANADKASAVGANCTASGARASAFGCYATASGYYSSAFGYTSTASAYRTSAVGCGNTASGVKSNAFGEANTASGYASQSFGGVNTSSGGYSTAVGYGNVASGVDSVAVGRGVTASGAYNATALGCNSSALSSRALAIGYNNSASAEDTVAVGGQCTASAAYASVFGSRVTNTTANSAEIGAANTEKLQISAAGVNYVTAGTGSFTVNGAPFGEDYTVAAISAGTTNVPATPLRRVYLADSAAGDVTVALPNALGWPGKVLHVKKTAAANQVIVQSSTGSQTIDGQANQILLAQYTSMQVTTDGNNWYIL